MGELDPQRRVAQYRLDRLVELDEELTEAAADADARADAAAEGEWGAAAPRGGAPSGPRPASMAARGAFADELVRQAMARGEFDNLPLHGKPIPGIGGRYDPDWWLKAFIEREQITGVLPEALQLRKDDAELDGVLDRLHDESRVRETLAEFNARIIEARRQLRGGPPVVTPLRDVDLNVTRWRERRRARLAEASARAEAEARARAAAAAERAANSRWRLPGRRRPRTDGRAPRGGSDGGG